MPSKPSPNSAPEVKPGVYEHYKGQRYLVLMTAFLESDLQPYVVYVPLYTSSDRLGHAWLRSVDDFMSSVTVHGLIRPRFRYVGAA